MAVEAGDEKWDKWEEEAVGEKGDREGDEEITGKDDEEDAMLADESLVVLTGEAFIILILQDGLPVRERRDRTCFRSPLLPVLKHERPDP